MRVTVKVENETSWIPSPARVIYLPILALPSEAARPPPLI
jgi:hypothetical protein